MKKIALLIILIPLLADGAVWQKAPEGKCGSDATASDGLDNDQNGTADDCTSAANAFAVSGTGYLALARDFMVVPPAQLINDASVPGGKVLVFGGDRPGTSGMATACGTFGAATVKLWNLVKVATQEKNTLWYIEDATTGPTYDNSTAYIPLNNLPSQVFAWEVESDVGSNANYLAKTPGVTPRTYSLTAARHCFSVWGQSGVSIGGLGVTAGTSASDFLVAAPPAIISALNSGTPTPTSTTVTWTTDIAADTQVEYGLTTAYGTSTTLDASLVTSHSVIINALQNATTYHWRAKSRIADGQLTVSADQTFATTTPPPPGDTPLGWWKLDDASGTTAADSSGNGNTLTLVNGPVWSTNPASLSFDGINDVAATATLSAQVTGAKTLTAWVTWLGGGHADGWIAGDVNEGWLSIHKVTGQVCYWDNATSQSAQVCSTAVLTQGVETFVAVKTDGATPQNVSIWVGATVATGTLSHAPPGTNDRNFGIGSYAQSGATRPVNAKIRYVRFYLSALADAVLQTLSQEFGVTPTVDTPTFTVPGGNYPPASSQTVTIQTVVTATAIYYTLDGTTPTPSSTLYSGALTVTTPKTIRAIATKAGYQTSASASAIYTFSGVNATYYVSPTGNDAAAGGVSTPWRTIQKAANTAVAGDVVSVAAGTYNERVTFPNSGTAGNPITFQGAGSASSHLTWVDGGTQVTSGWVAAAGFVTGVFEIANSAYGFTTPANATVDDKQFLFVSIDTTRDNCRAVLNLTIGNSFSCADAGGNSIAGGVIWDGMEAVCAKYGALTRCRFRDGANPNTKNLKLAPSETGAFQINNKSYITISGFAFKNAYSAIILTNFAHHITVSDNYLTNGNRTLDLRNGVHDTLIQSNRFFLNWIYPTHGLPRYINATTTDPIQVSLLQIMRGMFDVSESIFVRQVGDNNKILSNTLDHTGAAGINVAYFDPLDTTGEFMRNIEIGYNDISYCQDYCMLVQITKAPNLQIHDNFFHTYNSGVRLGQFLTGGPVYHYRNKYSDPEAFLTSSVTCDLEISGYPNLSTSIFTGTQGFFYHDTFNGNGTGICMQSQQSMDNFFWLNEVFSNGAFWHTDPGLLANPDFMKGNWISVNAGSPCCSFADAHNVITTGRIWPADETVFALPNGHAAIDYGINLSASWTGPGGATMPALPGMSPGYYNGSGPDAGSVEHP